MRKENNKIKYALLLALSLMTAGASPVGAQQATTLLRLEDCVKIALDKSTAALKANNNVATAGAQLLAAYGQFLPNAVASAGYNFDRGNNFYASAGATLADMTRSQYNYQLTSSVNVFTGYYNQANLKASRLNEEIAKLTLERAKQQIELDVTQAYFQLILDRYIVQLDSANLEISLKREDQLTVLTDVGRKAKTDLYQQQAQTSSDKLLFINAKNKLKNDKVLLLQKLRIDSVEQYEVADIAIDDASHLEKYGNLPALDNTALTHRADLKAALLNTQLTDWNIRKFKSGYLPTVSLYGGLYNNGGYFNRLVIAEANEKPSNQLPLSTQLYKYTYGLAGINASWNIFDRYATRSNVAQARISAQNARIDEADAHIAVNSNIALAYNDYKNAIQQLETTESGLFAATQAFESVNGRYKEGVTDFITVSNAQFVLLQARQNKIQASMNMMLQKKVIDYVTGDMQ